MARSPAESFQENISVLPDNHKRQFLSCKNRMFPIALCSYNILEALKSIQVFHFTKLNRINQIED